MGLGVILKITKELYEQSRDFIREHPESGMCLERVIMNYFPLTERKKGRKYFVSKDYMLNKSKRYHDFLDYSME